MRIRSSSKVPSWVSWRSAGTRITATGVDVSLRVLGRVSESQSVRGLSKVAETVRSNAR